MSVIIYLTRDTPYGIFITVASTKNNVNPENRRNRQVVRRVLVLAISRPLWALPRNRVIHPRSFPLDVFLSVYCLRFPA